MIGPICTRQLWVLTYFSHQPRAKNLWDVKLYCHQSAQGSKVHLRPIILPRARRQSIRLTKGKCPLSSHSLHVRSNLVHSISVWQASPLLILHVLPKIFCLLLDTNHRGLLEMWALGLMSSTEKMPSTWCRLQRCGDEYWFHSMISITQRGRWTYHSHILKL